MTPDEPRRLPARPPARSATIGGIGVVLLTGIAALFGFGANYVMTPIDWALAGLVALLTLAGVIALARFIRAHPGEIGEARFDTTHPDERD